MRLGLRLSMLAALAFVAAGCSECVEPGYEGGATDEAYLSLLDAEKKATSDDGKAALLTLPAPGSDVSLAGAPPTFEWTSGLVTVRPTPAVAPADSSFHALDLLISSAWAHGTPMAGVGHLVRLRVNGVVCPVQHFGSGNSWTPTRPEWSKVAPKGNQTLTVEFLSAYFTSNRVTEGPYVPSTQSTLQLSP